MIVEARILSKRLPGLNVDARQSSDPGSTSTTTSHSSGRSISRRNAIVMIGGPRILSKRLSGLNVDARRSRSKDHGGAATKSHSSGQSSSTRTTLSAEEDDEYYHQEEQLSHRQELIRLLERPTGQAHRIEG